MNKLIYKSCQKHMQFRSNASFHVIFTCLIDNTPDVILVSRAANGTKDPGTLLNIVNRRDLNVTRVIDRVNRYRNRGSIIGFCSHQLNGHLFFVIQS